MVDLRQEKAVHTPQSPVTIVTKVPSCSIVLVDAEVVVVAHVTPVRLKSHFPRESMKNFQAL